MNRWYPLGQLFLARLREFYREPEVIFWVYGFPLVLAIGLGVAFWSKKPDQSQVDIVISSSGSASLAAGEDDAAALQKCLTDADMKVETGDEGSCRQRLRTGRTSLIIIPTPERYTFIFDETRDECLRACYQADAAIVRWKAGDSISKLVISSQPTQEPGSRYIDFLLPGLVGLNLLGGGLWGVGFVIVDMRVRKLLKRLLATPVRRSDFLLSLLGARTVLMLPEMVLLLVVGWLAFGVPVHGNLLTLSLAVMIGAAAFAGIGLLLACRTDKTETISGLINLVMLPMWLLSGTFFPSKRFPDVVQPIIQALPLTQVNDALREIMLEGQTLAQVGWRLAILAGWAIVTFAVALRWFRWQ